MFNTYFITSGLSRFSDGNKNLYAPLSIIMIGVRASKRSLKLYS